MATTTTPKPHNQTMPLNVAEPTVPTPAKAAKRKPDPVLSLLTRMDKQLAEVDPGVARKVADWLYERYGSGADTTIPGVPT